MEQGQEAYQHLKLSLGKYSRGSSDRGKAFFEEFLRNAINYDGHVKPQSEFLAPVAGCGVPLDFIGRTERFAQDWRKLLAALHCDIATLPFDSSLGLHPNDNQDKTALQQGALSLFKVASDSHMAMEAAMAENGGAYLRGLCWLLLPDFAILDYDLPEGCREGSLLTLLQSVRQWLRGSNM
ncbi:unnamed protein product [Effrenium voratum]|nr:unnamed protein product [Effrenium voratum]